MLQEHSTLGPYEIRRLGGGAMGEVYVAFDTRLRREVALKVLTAAPGGAGGADHELKFDPIRADPRFPNLLRRMNLPS